MPWICRNFFHVVCILSRNKINLTAFVAYLFYCVCLKLKAVTGFFYTSFCITIDVLCSAAAYVEEVLVLKRVNIVQMSLMTISCIMEQICFLFWRHNQHSSNFLILSDEWPTYFKKEINAERYKWERKVNIK